MQARERAEANDSGGGEELDSMEEGEEEEEVEGGEGESSDESSSPDPAPGFTDENSAWLKPAARLRPGAVKKKKKASGRDGARDSDSEPGWL